MALGSIRHQTEVTGKSSGGDEGGRCLRLINSQHFCADCLEICVLQLPGKQSLYRPVQACKGIALHLTSHKFRN